MITLRPAAERGHASLDWLDSRHSFSFADYHDPRHMGVSRLRVINDDRIAPRSGFDAHPHRDMEIVTYVLEGTVEHKDSMGNNSRLKAGEVQVMSAGSGIVHSEYNPSASEPLHLLQIWIRPQENRVQPGYAQKDFSAVRGVGLLVSPDGREGSLPIHQDACLYLVRLDERQQVSQPTRAERTYYLHVASGSLDVNGVSLKAGDGATLSGEPAITLEAGGRTEALLFDLP
ncbi:pirin family protein [Azotobacter chroococcum subsp. isscasi]|uniref:pirin family protein n=1 Tax=Azotobacter chroococcum TaxID=353 RepID=UPI00103D46F0|nr:pirin family protein [Azotobacter chroococcum]TBW13065.1 pirin family protein [Azotobacter chroococcum subsp. isscasi]